MTLILGDSAHGTRLIAAGWRGSSLLANRDVPHLVRALHAGDRNAGAQWITSNTFMAPYHAVQFGWDETLPLLRAGIDIARDAAGALPIRVSLGPSGPPGAASQDVFGRLAVELGDEQVLLESFTTVGALAEAYDAIRGGLADRWACVAPKPGGDVLALAQELGAWRRDRGDDGPRAVGLNCWIVDSPDEAARVIAELDASLPRDVGIVVKPARPPFDALPNSVAMVGEQALLAAIRRLRRPAFLGGCCGTTPATIQQWRAKIDCVR